MLRDYGRYLKQGKDLLPPRDDVLQFDVWTNSKELEKNLHLQRYPSDLLEKVKELVTDYWDVFCEGGFCGLIQVFSFHIGTVNHSYICCKPPRYGIHESEVM